MNTDFDTSMEGSKETGRRAYQICMEDGRDPREYADLFRDKQVMKAGRTLVANIAPEELPHFEDVTVAILEGFRDAAADAGDNETASYVSNMLSQV